MAEGKTMASAAAAAGMSERSAYAWKQGRLPSETKEARSWRTRPDPFASVWDSEIVPMLVADTAGVLDATTVLSELQRRQGDSYGPGQLRTLQRRMHEWRALHGPDKEVMFEQRHEAGREGAFDFTDCAELEITVAGQAFAHLLFQFVLSFSKWRWVGLAFSETFEALLRGLQDALAAIGGSPQVWRSDNLSAATHQIPGGGRELNLRFASVLDHYGARSTRIEPGESHQNGVAEKAHHVLKSALAQALVLRGSRDFIDVDAYMGFVGSVRDRLNAGKPTALLAEERAVLRPLPRPLHPSHRHQQPAPGLARARPGDLPHQGRQESRAARDRVPRALRQPRAARRLRAHPALRAHGPQQRHRPTEARAATLARGAPAHRVRLGAGCRPSRDTRVARAAHAPHRYRPAALRNVWRPRRRASAPHRATACTPGGRVTAVTTDLTITITAHPARQSTRLSALACDNQRRLAAWLTCRPSTHVRALDDPRGTTQAVDPTRPSAPQLALSMPSCP